MTLSFLPFWILNFKSSWLFGFRTLNAWRFFWKSLRTIWLLLLAHNPRGIYQISFQYKYMVAHSKKTKNAVFAELGVIFSSSEPVHRGCLGWGVISLHDPQSQYRNQIGCKFFENSSNLFGADLKIRGNICPPPQKNSSFTRLNI